MSLCLQWFLVVLLPIFLYGKGAQHLKAKSRYSRVMLVRTHPVTPDQLHFLETLRYEKRGLLMQFWRHPDQLNRHVDVWISQVSFNKYKRLLAGIYLPYRIICRDIVSEAGKPLISMNNIEDYDGIYQKTDDVISEIRRLGVAYRDEISVDIIGKSYEGRPIHRALVHQNASQPKPIIFILCGSHAREWLSIAACQYLLRKLIFNQKYDEEISKLLDQNDIAIVPLLNPDGYSFTKVSRMWRKSRSKTKNPVCRGVDINRNFDYRWGGGGSSSGICEEIYCGEKPFSEKEPLALARHMYKIRRKIAAFMDIHTYGQLWMSPWGFTSGVPRDHVRHDTALRRIQQAILQKNGVTYRTGRSASTLAPTSGNALDFVYGKLHVVHSYATELRPHHQVMYNGFEAHGGLIEPSGEDLLVGIQEISNLMVTENLFLKNVR